MAITGSIQGTSKVKLYKELGHKSRRCSDIYAVFIKSKLLDFHPTFPILSHQVIILITVEIQRMLSHFIAELMPSNIHSSFAPSLNELDLTLSKSCYTSFENSLLKTICPSPNPVHNIHNPSGFHLLTRLRLGLSHLNEYKFNHNFKNCVNPLCTCSLEIESPSHFLLHCDHYNNIRLSLFNVLESLDGNILKPSDTTLINLILYCGSQFNIKQNLFILNWVIRYILESNRFNGSLF